MDTKLRIPTPVQLHYLHTLMHVCGGSMVAPPREILDEEGLAAYDETIGELAKHNWIDTIASDSGLLSARATQLAYDNADTIAQLVAIIGPSLVDHGPQWGGKAGR